jgi:hypothetical protein
MLMGGFNLSTPISISEPHFCIQFKGIDSMPPPYLNSMENDQHQNRTLAAI